MKKVTFFTAALLMHGVAISQLNSSFENWTGDEPDDWITNNQYAPFIGVSGLFVEQDPSSTSGQYSAKIITKSCPGCPGVGEPDPAPGFMEQIIPYSWSFSETARFEFDYKYIPAASTDTGYLQVRLTHWDSSLGSQVIDYIADEVISERVNWETASACFLPYTTSPGNPDTMTIQFFTSLGALQGVGTDTDGSALFVDSIRIVPDVWSNCLIGLSETDFTEVNVYPNPVSDLLIVEFDSEQVYFVDLIDLNGKVVCSESLVNGRNEIDLDDLENGIYVYTLYSEQKERLTSGKILVQSE